VAESYHVLPASGTARSFLDMLRANS
jgi:hypothetical protein